MNTEGFEMDLMSSEGRVKACATGAKWGPHLTF